MNNRKSTDFGKAISHFFQEYLPAQRGMSVNTIRSYRDSILLMLHFFSTDTGRKIEKLTLADFTAARIVRFLDYLESDRENCIGNAECSTGRNSYLGAFSDQRES